MIRIQRTESTDLDFSALVALLDAELALRDGAEHSFYAQFNAVAPLRHVLVAYENDRAVGCGAVKEFLPGIMEVKRMFVLPAHRKHGTAAAILAELERWSLELSCTSCVLETGKRQPEAITLYTKNGYSLIPNYGQYGGVENSLCFQKNLT